MFEEFNHFFQEEYFDLSVENEIIFEAYTKKQENRVKKFLKENNFKEDNSKLTKEQIRKGYRAGTIETSITDENGKKKRVDFEISPHDDNNFKYNTVSGEAKGIQMSKKTLARKPHIANFVFKHEEGHYACYLDKGTGKYVLDLYKIKRLIEKYPDDLKNQLNKHDQNPEEILADKYAQEHIPDKYKDKLYKTVNMKDYTIKFNKVIGLAFSNHNDSQKKINKAASKLFPNPAKVDNKVEELNNKKEQIKEIIRDETRMIEAEKELCDEQKKITNELHDRLADVNRRYSDHVMKGYITPTGRKVLKELKEDLENTNQCIIKIDNKIASKKEAQEYYQKIVDSCSVVAKPYLEEERKLWIASYDDESMREKLEKFRNNAPKEVGEFYKASSKLQEVINEIKKLENETYEPSRRAHELGSKIDKVRSGNKIDYSYKSLVNTLVNEIKEAEKAIDDYDKSIKKRKMKLQNLDRQIEKIDKKIKTVKNPRLEKMSYEQRNKYLGKYVDMILTNEASDEIRSLLSANTPEEIESLLKKAMNDPNFITESYGPEEDDTSGTSEFDESYNNDPDDCYCESFDLERLSPDIQLRPANEYYLDNIIEWKIQTILEGYPDEQPSPEEYNKISNYVKNETPKMLDDTRIIMYDNDQPIGMIIAYQKDQDWFIDDIFLIPEFRHKGIGRMILENEISNHNQLALWVYKSNIHAISLYESLGFKVEEAIKERQMMRLRKTDVEMTKGWRVTYQGIGIYEALKNAMFTQTGSPAAWMSFINSDACNWLPKPPSYGNDNKSFFTEEGFNRFNELVLPIIAQYIDQTKIYIEEIMVPTNQIVYSDEFQFVTSDTIQESYTDTKSVSILYKRWSTKNGEQYKPIAKFWDIVEKHVKASKLQGYGTDWTGYGTDFLYGIIFKDGNIPKEVIDDVKKAFPDMVVDNSFSIPSSFEETYSGDTENIDSLYDKIWSKGFLSHELEEFTDDGKCTIRVSYKNKVSQESTIPRSNEVYTNGGSIEKINDFPFDKVYFGSPNKLPTTMELDGPLFISPYPGIASIFSVRPQNLQKYGVPKGVRCNRDYDEWNKSLKDTVLQKPLTELHVRIQGENIKIKPTTELVSGYLYTIDVTPEIREHIYQSSKMSKVFEFCIDKMDSVTFSNIKKINVRMTVTGESGYIQEAKLPTSKRNKLPDSDFALVYTDATGKKIRKYPVYDKAHVEAAAKMFPRGIPLKYQKKVAKRILREAHGYDIDTSEWKLNKYK